MAATYEDTIDTSSVDARRGDVVLQKIVDKNTLPIAGDILVGTGGSVTKGANNAYTVANVTRLAAGTAGLPLVSNGVGAMPGYQQLPGASIQTYSIDATTKLTKPVMSGLSGRVQYTLQCAYDEQDDRTDLVWNTIDGSGAIADGSIYTAQLANAAVTNAKIADLAITDSKFADTARAPTAKTSYWLEEIPSLTSFGGQWALGTTSKTITIPGDSNNPFARSSHGYGMVDIQIGIPFPGYGASFQESLHILLGRVVGGSYKRIPCSFGDSAGWLELHCIQQGTLTGTDTIFEASLYRSNSLYTVSNTETYLYLAFPLLH